MLGGLIAFTLVLGFVSPHKLCTNMGYLSQSHSNSHTARYESFLMKNSSSVADLHSIPRDDQTRSTSIPRNVKYRNITRAGGESESERGDGFLREIWLHDVRLDPNSIHGVLGIQRGTDPGVMIYMYPLHAGASKARSTHGWGTKFDSFWCCYGTGIESFSKLGDSIYFEEMGEVKGLYIIQYIPSTVRWRSGQVVLSQRVEPLVSWDQRLQVTVAISSKMAEVTPSTLKLRIPSWAYSNGSKASLNGQELSVPAPGNFLSITNSWSSGDKIELVLPLGLRSEAIQDDRPEYASVQAFLYGPYLLAGLSSGDWDVIIESHTCLSESFTPIPADRNSQLITLAREFRNSTFVLSSSEKLIKMEKAPEPGTDAALRATFRLIVQSGSSHSPSPSPSPAAIGKSVVMELFDFPGMHVLHNGEGESLTVSNSSSVFRLVAGLDGEEGTVSLESESQHGCYVYTNDSGAGVKLKCGSGSSFVLQDGVSKYHATSFIARGLRRNFVLSPLYSLRDESYTVYFNTSIMMY